MGWYGDRVLPRIIDVACGTKVVVPQRQRGCEQLHGRVLEMGFGSGLNVPYYPAAVTTVDALEPSDVAWKLAGDRTAASSVPVRRSALDGELLPYGEHSFDTALSTRTLCTIPHPVPRSRADPGPPRRLTKSFDDTTHLGHRMPPGRLDRHQTSPPFACRVHGRAFRVASVCGSPTGWLRA